MLIEKIVAEEVLKCVVGGKLNNFMKFEGTLK